MSNYLLELSLIHIAMVAGYWLLLRKERHYGKLRFYLLGSALLALVIPLLKLPKLFFGSSELVDVIPMEAIELDAMTVVSTADRSFWTNDLLTWIYIGISAFFLLKFFGSVLYLVYLERKSSYEKFNNLYIRKIRNIKGSFTFFNWIFLSDEIDIHQQDYAVILKHEKAHATLGHSYDIMFFELLKVCFWWLPTVWYSIKEIKKIHEYQADASALKSCNVDQYSSILISSTLKSNGLSLASSLDDGLILKRLIAMKQKTKNVSPWKLGALMALCALLIVAFACSEEQNKESKEAANQSNDEIFVIVEELPEFEGGMDAFYNYVRNEMTYPLQARQMGIEGRVDVQFVVEKDGSLSDVKAIMGIGAGCDGEAIRVVKNAGSFKPGSQRGKAVRVRMVMPIIFKLDNGKTNADKSAQGIIVIEKAESKNGALKVEASYANGEWSGIVRDPEGEVLPGANILVAGTTTGTASALDGSFKVKANESNELYVSFVGYDGVKVGANKQP